MPVLIFSSVIAVAAGDFCSFALRADGTLWAWGANEEGQLNTGDREDRSIPTRILNGVIAIAAGSKSAFAVLQSGALVAWGDNTSGLFGPGIALALADQVKTCPSTFPACYHDGDCVVEACRQGCSWERAPGMSPEGSRYNYIDGTDNSGATCVLDYPDTQGLPVALVASGCAHSLFVYSDGALQTAGHNAHFALGTADPFHSGLVSVFPTGSIVTSTRSFTSSPGQAVSFAGPKWPQWTWYHLGPLCCVLSAAAHP